MIDETNELAVKSKQNKNGYSSVPEAVQFPATLAALRPISDDKTLCPPAHSSSCTNPGSFERGNETEGGGQREEEDSKGEEESILHERGRKSIKTPW